MGRAAPSSQLRLGVALIAALLLASCGSHREGVEPARLPPEVCLARLDALHVSYEKSASPEGPCPIYDPVSLRSAGPGSIAASVAPSARASSCSSVTSCAMS